MGRCTYPSLFDDSSLKIVETKLEHYCPNYWFKILHVECLHRSISENLTGEELNYKMIQ